MPLSKQIYGSIMLTATADAVTVWFHAAKALFKLHNRTCDVNVTTAFAMNDNYLIILKINNIKPQRKRVDASKRFLFQF